MPSALHIHDNAAALFEATAKRIVELGNEAITQRGEFHIALSGGNTPRALYRCLGAPPMREKLDWSRVHLWFSDERCVPPEHADSNYRMAIEALLNRLPVDIGQFHRMEGELTPEVAAQRYGNALSLLPHDSDGTPRFDLVLLGLGADGHIASLFPDTSALEVTTMPVVALHATLLQSWRLTLTFPVLNHARHLLILVSGEKKADVLRHIFCMPTGARPLPVQLLKPAEGALEWYIDRDAARYLPGGA